ncbi:uncharacterized protein LOC100371206 [Saccoglossus kowalevskii]|uniref:Probable inactive protein kinase DDB_G0270444-like n=1 Tax=Saccoglossus kowalevskii TaxID=10224 RepID=A0ABM0GNZ6_SACKO|nr:PREDICTED: probable inactive protein kinase DDB_G0270444-like [Saccoglossus kowalevskii]
MTSTLLLGILLAVGLSVQANANYKQLEKQKALLDALEYVEKAMQEQEVSEESVFENDQLEETGVDDYETYIEEHWPEEAPEINLHPGPPIKEPPFNNVGKWEYMNEAERFPIGGAYPAYEIESEFTNILPVNEVVESVEEFDEEPPASVFDIDKETLEKMMQVAMDEGMLGDFEPQDSVDEIDDFELEPESSEQEFEESIVDEVNDEPTSEEEAMLEQLTEEIMEEVRAEIGKEIGKIAEDAITDLTDEVTAQVVEELKNGEIGFNDIDEAFGQEEGSESETDEDYLQEFWEASQSEEEKVPDKRDEEYAFGAWEDSANEDRNVDQINEVEVLNDMEEEGDDYDDDNVGDENDVTWKALQYLYGPYLDNVKQELIKYDSDEDVSNEIANGIYLEDSEFDDESYRVEEDNEEEESDYDYSTQGEDAYEEMYEEVVAEAVKELEDEAADTARKMVDEMLLSLVREEEREEQEEAEEEAVAEAERERLAEQYDSEECQILDYVVDNCEVIDLYEGLGDNGYREAFTGPCNRHQLCYICSDTYQLSETLCDKVFYGEMTEICEDSAACLMRAEYFLKVAQLRDVPENNPYLDFVCRNRCVLNALYE